MRSYVLTERERRILRRFIDTEEKLDGFAGSCLSARIFSDEFDEVADEALKRAEDKKKARLRTRVPYRKARVET